MIKRFFITIIAIAIGLNIQAQQLPQNNQFLINKASFIPALSGYNGNIESFLTYRHSWIGIAGSPKLGLLNINGALKEQMGFGFSVSSENTGNFNQTFITGSYSYHIKLGENSTISTALSPMFYRNQLNLSKIKSHGTQIDPMLLNTDKLAVNIFDIGVSVAFSMNNLRVGVNVPQTIGLKSKFNESDQIFKMQRHYLGFASYLIKKGKFAIEPMALVRATEKSPINYGGAIMIKYKEHLWCNLGYNADQSVLFSVGVLSGQNFVVNYSYELGLSGLSQSALGTHEVTIGFLIKQADTPKSNSSIFAPELQTENKNKINQNVTNKINEIEQQLKKEKEKRQQNDNNLQEQILELQNNQGTANVDGTNSQRWKQKIVTRNIIFGVMNTNIAPSSYSELNKYVQLLSKDSELNIKILVYENNQYSETINNDLSEKRAKAIYDYLISKKINAGQLEYKGMGAINPIEDNTTAEGREKNNRVEILLNKKIY